MKTLLWVDPQFNDWKYFNAYMNTIPPWIEITEVITNHDFGHRWCAKHNGQLTNDEPHQCIAFKCNAEPVGPVDALIRGGMWVYVIRTDVPWCKQFRTFVHLCKTIKEPILNNVEIYNENKNL